MVRQTTYLIVIMQVDAKRAVKIGGKDPAVAHFDKQPITVHVESRGSSGRWVGESSNCQKTINGEATLRVVHVY